MATEAEEFAMKVFQKRFAARFRALVDSGRPLQMSSSRDLLANSGPFWPECVEPVAPKESFEALCKRMGVSAEDDCDILSIDLTLDGTRCSFADAMKIERDGVPGSLFVVTARDVAYFVGELPNEYCIVRPRRQREKGVRTLFVMAKKSPDPF